MTNNVPRIYLYTITTTLFLAVVFALIVIGNTIVIYPALLDGSGTLSVGLLVALLVVYGLLALVAPTAAARRHRAVFFDGFYFGLLIGLILLVLALHPYIFALDKQGATLVNAVLYFLMCFMFFMAGIAGTLHTRFWRDGVWAAPWSAFIAAILFVAVFLFAYRLLWFTGAFDRMVIAEGLDQEFVMSGLADLRLFVTQNRIETAFFHLWIIPLVSFIFGGLGGVIGKWRVNLSTDPSLPPRGNA